MMQTHHVVVDRQQARALYRKYKEHAAYSKPVDREIQRAYQLIAQGKVVIQAFESIKQAGLDAKGLPKLALAMATATEVDVRMYKSGSCLMDSRGDKYRYFRGSALIGRACWTLPADSFPRRAEDIWRATSLVPGIPIHLRPKRGLANYHVLYEAEWTKIVPRDPMLLRRIGRADLWLVVAAWDLTDVERAALSTRI